MKIRAKFKGQDGSLGYKNGSVYNLFFYTQEAKRALDLKLKGNVIIEPLDNKGSRCPYSSLRKFLDNWEVL